MVSRNLRDLTSNFMSRYLWNKLMRDLTVESLSICTTFSYKWPLCRSAFESFAQHSIRAILQAENGLRYFSARRGQSGRAVDKQYRTSSGIALFFDPQFKLASNIIVNIIFQSRRLCVLSANCVWYNL